MIRIFIILTASGFVGGLVKFCIKKKNNKFWEQILVSICASFIVPLFLNITSSEILKDIILKDTQNEYPNIFILIGFCLIASISSEKFIEVVSNKTFEQVVDFKNSVDNMNENLNDLLSGHGLINNKYNSFHFTEKNQDLSMEEIKILVSIKCSGKKVINSIKSDIGFMFDEKSVYKLKDKNFITITKNKDCSLTDEGEKVLCHILKKCSLCEETKEYHKFINNGTLENLCSSCREE